jgi:hypothetical protein
VSVPLTCGPLGGTRGRARLARGGCTCTWSTGLNRVDDTGHVPARLDPLQWARAVDWCGHPIGRPLRRMNVWLTIPFTERTITLYLSRKQFLTIYL